MKGWLVTNCFFRTKKLDTLYEFLSNSCKTRNIELQHVTTADLVMPVGETWNKSDLPDFAIFWDKDINVATQLEQAGVPVFNSAHAIQLADNKTLTAYALNGKVPTPKTIVAPKTFEGVGYTDFTFLHKASQTLGFPLVIKESYGSFGQQVYLANDLQQAKDIVQSIGWKEFVMQQFVDTSYGIDVRVNVVGDKVVSAMLRHNPNDFRSNISNGGNGVAFSPSAKMQQIAIAATKALGLDFAGVDILRGKQLDTDEDFANPIVCEVNSNPHFKSSLDATGVDMSQLIVDYIVEKLRSTQTTND